MTDKEKLQYILDTNEDTSIESIFHRFLMLYGHDLPITSINQLRREAQLMLDMKIEDMNHANYIAWERATYLKRYLEGKMWSDEASARANLEPQIENAQAIIDACGRR